MKPAELFTASPFDQAAENYDREFTTTSAGMLQRRRVHYFLEHLLPDSSSLKILEINCGTGEDAIWLARKGHEVKATDASDRMIAVANKKLSGEQNKINLSFQVTSFSNLIDDLKGNSYDIVFSDFGGLNCIPPDDLEKLAGDIRKLLNPGGKLIGVIMGRNCIWEKVYFMIKGKWKQSFRRLGKHAVKAPVGTGFQDTWYYSPSEIKKLLGKEMTTIMLKPVGLALPPSYLENFFKKRTHLLTLLNRLENISDFSFMTNFADHFFIVLEKKRPE